MNTTPTSALVALGGNIGDVPLAMQESIALLAAVEEIRVLKKSHLYSTAPVGTAAGEPFVNAAMTVHTSLEPIALLDQLQRIETELGRERTTHWGPRVLDLDLILYGDKAIHHERLTVPHPASFYRRFVLDPACDIAADWAHPKFGVSLKELRSRLLRRPLQVALHGDRQLVKQLSKITDSETIHIIHSDFLDNDSRRPLPSNTASWGQTESAAIVFDTRGSLRGPNVVRLHEAEHLTSFAQQILTAATDEPVCVGDWSL